MDGVLLVEFLDERAFEGEDVGEEGLEDEGCADAMEEEGDLWVFGGLGFAGFESSGGASCAWFAVGG